MRTITLLLIICSFTAQSQDSYYEFKNVLNSLISKKNKEVPTVFEVASKTLVIQNKSKQKVETKLYKQAYSELKLALKDSVTIDTKNESKLNRYHKINEIKSNINQFINSKTPYKLKKQKLIAAQKLSDEIKLDFLIYSDDTVNPQNKAKFFILSMNQLDLKVHLKKIVWKIESTNKKPDLTPNNISEKIKKLRNKLKTIERYEFINGPIRSKKSSAMVLGNEINTPDTMINGQFKHIGEYYVILRKNKTETFEALIPANKVNIEKPNNYNFVFEVPASLIQQKNSGNLFLVATGFLEEYSLTKLSQQKKFKDKAKLPFKIYSTVNERLIDSIILDYNRITLNLK